jgi:hypothetical protein
MAAQARRSSESWNLFAFADSEKGEVGFQLSLE